MVILDEITMAVELGLLAVSDIVSLMKKTPKRQELILTGRCAHPDIIRGADLVSEIHERKHYFRRGIRARKGIEF
jgi:cob(I)alamin adenosyltransferase